MFVFALATNFSLKDLNFPSYFFGLELLPTKTGLFLSQQRYICDFYEKANMSGVKPMATLMSMTCHFSLDSPYIDSKLYCNFVGFLQFLALT